MRDARQELCSQRIEFNRFMTNRRAIFGPKQEVKC